MTSCSPTAARSSRWGIYRFSRTSACPWPGARTSTSCTKRRSATPCATAAAAGPSCPWPCAAAGSRSCCGTTAGASLRSEGTATAKGWRACAAEPSASAAASPSTPLRKAPWCASRARFPEGKPLQAQQPLRVAAQDPRFRIVGDRQRAERFEHQGDAADLVGIVAAGQDVIGTGKFDRELESALVEIHRVVIEMLLQIFGRRPVDVRAALGERAIAAVETLREVGNG